MESTEGFGSIELVERASWFTLALPFLNTGILLAWAMNVWLQFGRLLSFNNLDLREIGLGVLMDCITLSALILLILFLFASPFAIFFLVIAGLQRKAFKIVLRNLLGVLLLDALHLWFILADPLCLRIFD